MDELEAYKAALEPSDKTKARYMGEFSFNITHYDEDGEEYRVKQYVPWTTIKEIMKAIVDYKESLTD